MELFELLPQFIRGKAIQRQAWPSNRAISFLAGKIILIDYFQPHLLVTLSPNHLHQNMTWEELFPEIDRNAPDWQLVDYSKMKAG